MDLRWIIFTSIDSDVFVVMTAVVLSLDNSTGKFMIYWQKETCYNIGSDPRILGEGPGILASHINNVFDGILSPCLKFSST
jgi:hypothetical protein